MRALKIYLVLSIFSGFYAQVVSEHLYYGPSSLSMAGSDIAVPQTSWSVFVNPAGIAKQKNLSLVAGSESLFGQEYFSHSFFAISYHSLVFYRLLSKSDSSFIGCLANLA